MKVKLGRLFVIFAIAGFASLSYGSGFFIPVTKPATDTKSSTIKEECKECNSCKTPECSNKCEELKCSEKKG